MKLFLLAFLASGAPREVHAAQAGPVFPTHRYPTDKSFHISYRLEWLRSRSNFVSSTTYKALEHKATYTLIDHQLVPEYQPNRNLSIGAIISLYSASLNASGKTGASASGFGDQRVFIEYRFFDIPGASVGGALLAKFPGYSNPNVDNADVQAGNFIAVPGDAQTDITLLATSEMWFSTVVRGRADLGFTYRTEQFGAEIPFLFSLGYANPRLDLELRFKGNFVAQKGSPVGDADSSKRVRAAFANSDFAYSTGPTVVMAQPSAEFWISPRFALSVDYTHTLFGIGAPYFQKFAFGVTFREASTKRTPRKTFREVDIGTDQETGQFQGELQSSPGAPPPESSSDEDEEF